MKKPKEDNGVLEKRKFVVDPDFDDPLLKVDMSKFEEIEVEEISSYYNVHLGIPIEKEE
jgi:hypothetical protein